LFLIHMETSRVKMVIMIIMIIIIIIIINENVNVITNIAWKRVKSDLKS